MQEIKMIKFTLIMYKPYRNWDFQCDLSSKIKESDQKQLLQIIKSVDYSEESSQVLRLEATEGSVYPFYKHNWSNVQFQNDFQFRSEEQIVLTLESYVEVFIEDWLVNRKSNHK